MIKYFKSVNYEVQIKLKFKVYILYLMFNKKHTLEEKKQWYEFVSLENMQMMLQLQFQTGQYLKNLNLTYKVNQIKKLNQHVCRGSIFSLNPTIPKIVQPKNRNFLQKTT